jgi:DNA-directed RNA polymerase specialized sigma24 family protein
MKSNTVNAAVNTVVHMGWLYPDSGIAEIICPDLVAKARLEEWDVQRFIREAIPRVPMWVRSRLGIKTHLLEATAQKFIFQMIARRPDLFYDPSKGPLEAYIVGLLWKVYQETRREERFGQQEEGVKYCEDFAQRPAAADLEDQEELEMALKLIEKLPPDQRFAVAQKYLDDNESELRSEIPPRVIRVWRCRGLRTVRNQAERMGLRLSKARIFRARLHRSRRMVRGRGRPNRRGRLPIQLREATAYGTLNGGSFENIGMSDRQKTIEASNALALRALVDSLPKSLKERIEVLATVREVFEREFARRSKRRASPGSSGNANGLPSS